MSAYTNSHFREDTDGSFDYILGLTFEWQHTQRIFPGLVALILGTKSILLFRVMS